MTIEIRDEALQGVSLTQDQALLELAIGMFAGRKVTLGRAARIAGLPQAEFLKELGRRGIPIHYDVEDFAADLKTLAALKNDRRQ
jgi:predicted HTH domain antitoxin